MNLDTVDKSLEIILGEAKTTTDCDITASYADNTQYNFLLVENDTVSNGTTAVTVVAAPAFDTQRQVKEVRIHNNDTVTHQVTLRLNNAGTFRIIGTASVGSGGDCLYTPETEMTVSSAGPAILLESGTTGAKISAMASGDTLVAGFTITSGALLAMEQAGVNYGWSIGSVYTFTAAITDYVNNPLDATSSSGNSGSPVGFVAGNGDGSGSGGNAALVAGDSGLTGGAGGNNITASGSARGAAGNGGDYIILLGTGAGASRNGALICALPSIDPAVTNGLWASNQRIVVSGATITPVASTVTSGAAVALTTGTAKDVTTISVPAGNWTITGACYFTGNAATTVTLVQGSVGTAANTLDTTPGQVDTEYLAAATIATLAADPALPGLSADVTLGSPTTYRLDAKATFAVNTLSAYGTIRAVPRA